MRHAWSPSLRASSASGFGGAFAGGMIDGERETGQLRGGPLA